LLTTEFEGVLIRHMIALLTTIIGKLRQGSLIVVIEGALVEAWTEKKHPPSHVVNICKSMNLCK